MLPGLSIVVIEAADGTLEGFGLFKINAARMTTARNTPEAVTIHNVFF